MRRIWLVVTSVTVAVVLAGGSGCGGTGKAETTRAVRPVPKEVDITLDGYAGAENVGILMAEERGYFRDQGLDVWVRLPASRLSPLPYVAGEEVDLAVSHGPEVALAQEKGLPVEAFGSLIARPTAAMIWLNRSGIGGIADLKGKTIAFTGLAFERNLIRSILARAGLTLGDVKLEAADYDLVSVLEGGRADAILGSWNLEGAELRARGLKPVITPVEKLGIRPYEELVLIGRPDFLSRYPQLGPDLMSAIARGTAAAVADPDAAARVIERKNSNPNPAVIEAQLKATLPLLSKGAG